MKRRNGRGLTLAELIIVIAIAVILVAVPLAALSTYTPAEPMSHNIAPQVEGDFCPPCPCENTE